MKYRMINRISCILLALCILLIVFRFRKTFSKAASALTFAMMIVNMIMVLYLVQREKKLRNNYRQMEEQLEQEKERGTEAELERKKQELLALQAQINPHFLYNTLDTFRGYAIEHQDFELSRMIAALSSMFKYSVNYKDEVVTINAEMNYLKKYIQLQQVRFPSRFQYVEEIRCDEKLLLSQPCPRFVLQPLAENAIRHGLKDIRTGGLIRLTIDMTENEIIIVVSDNGKGMDSRTLEEMNNRFRHHEDLPPQDHGGLGLYNVNRRIKIFCGEVYGLHAESSEGIGTDITVRLPRGENQNA